MKTFSIFLAVCYAIMSLAWLGKGSCVAFSLNALMSLLWFAFFVFRGMLEYEKHELQKIIDVHNKEFGTNYTIESLLKK